MDEESFELMQSIAVRIVKEESRTDIVNSLIEDSISPDTAQRCYDVAMLYGQGQGYFGFDKWFWGILMNRVPQPKGAVWVWLTGVLSIMVCLPINIEYVGNLPSGTYPVVIFVIPGMMFAVVLTMIIARIIFKYSVMKK